jgi:hypothetical protein
LNTELQFLGYMALQKAHRKKFFIDVLL